MTTLGQSSLYHSVSTGCQFTKPGAAKPMSGNNLTPKPKVFGLGFQKTGTSSLGVILKRLEYRPVGYHDFRDMAADDTLTWDQVRDRALGLAADADSAKDTPWPLLYREMDETFPRSKFIHVTRNPESWIRSAVNDFGNTPNALHKAIYGVDYPLGFEEIWLDRYNQHNEDVTHAQITEAIIEEVIKKAIPSNLLEGTKYFVNPTGRFVIGGPMGDAGLTGRKIIVDTYGGHGSHGGGAFSGKDTTKVDRSAAYASRYLAKNVVAAKLAEKCTIQLSYAIGVAQPLSVYVDLHGTGTVSEEVVEAAIRETMDLSPTGIRKHLDLNKPIYAQSAAYGHFGRKPGRNGSFSWERTNLTTALKRAVKEAK